MCVCYSSNTYTYASGEWTRAVRCLVYFFRWVAVGLVVWWSHSTKPPAADKERSTYATIIGVVLCAAASVLVFDDDYDDYDDDI